MVMEYPRKERSILIDETYSCFHVYGFEMGFDPHYELSFQSHRCRTPRDMEKGEIDMKRRTQELSLRKDGTTIDEKACRKKRFDHSYYILSP